MLRLKGDTFVEKTFFLVVSTVIILVASGAVYAFAPLQLVLVDAGVYSELCTGTTGERHRSENVARHSFPSTDHDAEEENTKMVRFFFLFKEKIEKREKCRGCHSLTIVGTISAKRKGCN